MTLSSVTARSTASLRGLITEGNEVNTPDNSNLAESNYELLHDGSRRRRRPLIEEKGDRSVHRQLSEGNAVSGYLWQTPAREEHFSIVVEEVEGKVMFYGIDHNDLTHISETPMGPGIQLELFGRYDPNNLFGGETVPFSAEHPCTYTEGNGSLFIFNRFTGTIKVDMVYTNDRRRILRYTPIGTWIRDFEGLETGIDRYKRPDYDDSLPGFNQSLIFGDQNLVDGIHEDLDNAHGYNLTNQGWPEVAIARFATESQEDYEQTQRRAWFSGNISVVDTRPQYPAYMDRYLDGRMVLDNGNDVFDVQQLREAPERRGEPAKGARIGHSDLTGAGSLQSVPIRLDSRLFQVNQISGGDTLEITIVFPEIFMHTPNGRPASDLAAFLNYMTFTAEKDGVTYPGGFSGVVDTDRQGSIPGARSMVFKITNPVYADYTNFRITAAYAHPSPVYTAHRVDVREGYDYRQARRPSGGAYYAGRLWQFGDEHNRIYFSQQIPESSQGRGAGEIARESMCYMENSPTDGDDNAIVDTDGGYVTMTDSGNHLQGVTLLSSLLISTDTGVWEIKGNDRTGDFRPGAFGVRRLSKAEVLGPKAMVQVNTEVHVATADGIIRIFPDERSGILKTESMTHTTIKSELDSLIEERREAIGAYDMESRTVRWAFPLRNTYTSTDRDSASPMLTYHMQHNAWYRYDFGFGGAVADMIVLPYTIDNPTYNRYRYLITAVNLLGTPSDLRVEWGIEAEFGPTGPNEWVDFHDPDALFADFLDVNIDPVEREAPEAFMLTNHVLLGAGHQWSTINYVTAFNREVSTNLFPVQLDEDEVLSYSPNIEGSTKLQVQWDWFTGTGRGKHGPQQETYRYRRHYITPQTSPNNPAQDRDEALIVSKQKVRGRGREFRLKWSSSEHKDSHLVGWSLSGLVHNSV